MCWSVKTLVQGYPGRPNPESQEDTRVVSSHRSSRKVAQDAGQDLDDCPGPRRAAGGGPLCRLWGHSPEPPAYRPK